MEAGQTKYYRDRIKKNLLHLLVLQQLVHRQLSLQSLCQLCKHFDNVDLIEIFRR